MNVVKIIKGRRCVYKLFTQRRGNRVRTILKYVGLAENDRGMKPWN